MDKSLAHNAYEKLRMAKLHSYLEVRSQGMIGQTSSLVPNAGGVYAWYYKEMPLGSCILLYIGESINLHDRIQEHCISSDNSPMRQKLDTIIHGTRGMIERVNEERLNAWMQENAFVCWVEEPEHKEAEKYIIGVARPPLNSEYNPNFRYA